ncbi:DUF421 domain-containing protein [Nocardiopsis sp. RSe5-2]|uniref:DUF421 domain-containing protein n=1 Tax=Nocardiopsis endophytica TaxID=3018445 RepID=A0ABT4UEW9_9ACTN|nr:YetF domain-containing protein [Nocardiopsis endophytica]MDA2814887.1 DUF421 domain-containing protein [Nocardiopsis endophytica]
MWQDMFAPDLTLAEKTVRTVLVYLAIYLLLRLVGRRDLAQLNTMDLVVVLLLSNVVQNAVIGPDYSVTGGIIGAVVLMACDWVMVHARNRWYWAWRLFEGRTSVLVRKGEYDRRTMRRLGVRKADVEQVVRRDGGSHVGDAERVMLEPQGTLRVELRHGKRAATAGQIDALEERLALIEELLRGRAGNGHGHGGGEGEEGGGNGRR